jgi:O-antigen ligase
MAAPLSTALMGLVGLTLALAVFAGGSSQFAMISTAAAELGALPLLGLGLWMQLARPVRDARWPLLILAAGVVVAAVELAPLPAALWRSLPGRAAAWSAIVAAGGAPAMAPASLDPGASARSLVSIAPAVAIFLGVAALDWRRRERLTWALAALAVLGALVGLAQTTGHLRSFYTVTNPGSAVGFFANRNHLAALLCAALPLAAGLSAVAMRRRDGKGAQPAVVGAASAAGLCLIGAVATGSRAGMLLAVAALIGSAAMLATRGSGRPTAGAWRPALLAIGAIGLTVVLQFTRLSAFDTTKAGSVDEGRTVVTATTIAAAGTYAPVGAGLGTFPSLYAAVEPADRLTSEYFNHAHDDWAELWLEGGWPMAAVVLVFLGWYGAASLRAWRGAAALGAPDILLPRAASLSIALLLVHSSVDYPLRTIADMTVFAFACGLMVRPPAQPRPGPGREQTHHGRIGSRSPIPAIPAGYH